MCSCTTRTPAGRRSPLIAVGVNDCEIARRLGVAADDNPRLAPAALRHSPRSLPSVLAGASRRLEFSEPPDYAELLGLYLGDGHIKRPRLEHSGYGSPSTPSTRRSWSDDRLALLRRLLPARTPVGRRALPRRRRGGPRRVLAPPLLPLPQHGPGKKHERPIVLEPGSRRSSPPRRGASCAAASAPTVASSSTAPGATSTSATTSPTTRATSSTSSATCPRRACRPRRYAQCVRLYRRERRGPPPRARRRRSVTPNRYS